MKLDNLRDVLNEQLADLYSAEQQLVDALPKAARAASNGTLRQAFEEHLEQTRGHVERLREAYGTIGSSPGTETCEAMQGLIAEAEEIIEAPGTPDARDAALIAAAQRVEHYEIAAYGSARTMAAELGLDAAAGLLEETLDEEKEADKLLNKIATGGLLSSGVNRDATP